MRYVVPEFGTNSATQAHGFNGLWINLDLYSYHKNELCITSVTLSGCKHASVRIRSVDGIHIDSKEYSPFCTIMPITSLRRSIVVLSPGEYYIDILSISEQLMG